MSRKGRKGRKDDWRPPPTSDSGYRRTSDTRKPNSSTASSGTWGLPASDTVNGWGSSPTISSNEPAMSTRGWGSTAADNHPPADSADGWGSTSGWGSDAWGSTNAWGSSWGESKTPTDVKSSGPAFRAPGGDTGWGSQSTEKLNEPKKPNSRSRLAKIDTRISPLIAHKSPTEAQSPYSAIRPKNPEDVETKNAAPRKIPLPTRIRPPLPTRLKQPNLPRGNSPFPSPKDRVASRTLQDDAASDASTPTSRSAKDAPKDLHEKLIKAMVSAVITRYQLFKAEEKKSNWRAARASTCYLHSTPAAQKKLDAINQQYSEEIAKLTKHLHSSLRQVIWYTDALNASRDLVGRGIDPHKVASYTAELRDWVKDLDLPKRLLSAQELAMQEKNEKKAFERRKQEEVDLLKASLAELEQRATDISDDFFYLQFIHDNEIHQVSKSTEEALGKKDPESFLDLETLFENLGIGKDVIRRIENRAKVVDQDFDEQLTKVTELVGQVNVLEKQVEELRQKNHEIQDFHEAAQAKLEQMAQWKVEDQAKLDDLAGRIENLHQLPRRQPPMASPPIKVEDLTPYITALAQEYVMKEIKPALDSIAESCQANNKVVQADFDRLLGQILEKTYELCQASLRKRGLVPRVVSQQVHPSTPS